MIENLLYSLFYNIGSPGGNPKKPTFHVKSRFSFTVAVFSISREKSKSFIDYNC